jgi:outer membrane protein
VKRLATRLILAAAIGAATVPAFAATDLLELYKSGRDSDPQYLAAIALAHANAEAAPQAFAALLPHVSLSAFASQSDRRIIESGNPFNSAGSALVKGATATLTQSLIAPQKWASYQQGRLQAESAMIEAGIAEQALIIRAAQAYFQYLSSKSGVRFADAEFNALEKDLEQATSRYDVGLATITDLHETQARYDLASAQQISADQDLLNALDILSDIMGYYVDTQLPDVGPDIALSDPEGKLEIWVSEALSGNLSLKLAMLQTALSERRVQSQLSGHLPTLDAILEYGYSDSTDQEFGNRGTDVKAQVLLNIPLFQGGAVSSRVRQARAQLRSSEAQQERIKREVEVGIRSSHRGVSTAAKRAAALKQASKSVQTALEATQAGYDVGTRTIVDVLNARREVFRAESNFSQARYDYVLQQLNLYKQHGSLGPQHIVAMNELLK